MKYSVEQKRQVVEEGLCQLEKSVHKEGSINNDMSQWLDLFVASEDFRCAHSVNHSHDMKVYRLKKRISPVVSSGNSIFVTLTFRDDVLASTSPETRRRYVSRFLKDVSPGFYVGNIDYGDKEKNPYSKEREHYHGVIFSQFFMDPTDMKDPLRLELQSKWAYGWSGFGPVGTGVKDQRKISKYVCKLSGHAFKPSTKGTRVIYSRRPKYEN